MKKLTENLQELSSHVANTEKKVDAAEQESREKLEASIKKSKAGAKVRQQSFKAKIHERQPASASQWEELQENFNQKVLQIKNKWETEKDVREVKKANKEADDAEADGAQAYAEAAILFVYLAIDEAEIAVLEVIEARAYAEAIY